MRCVRVLCLCDMSVGLCSCDMSVCCVYVICPCVMFMRCVRRVRIYPDPTETSVSDTTYNVSATTVMLSDQSISCTITFNPFLNICAYVIVYIVVMCLIYNYFIVESCLPRKCKVEFVALSCNTCFIRSNY